MKTDIHEFLAHITGPSGDICSEVYFNFLKNAPEHTIDNLLSLLTDWGDVESDGTVAVKKYYSKEEYSSTFASVQPLIKQLLGKLLEKNSEPREYCTQLWDRLTNEELFPTDLESICALLYVLISPHTPYFQLSEPVRMDDEKYRSIGKTIELQVKKALFALNKERDQRTEIASQLLSICKSISDEEAQVVFWAMIIGYFEIRQAQFLKELNSRSNPERNSPTE